MFLLTYNGGSNKRHSSSIMKATLSDLWFRWLFHQGEHETSLMSMTCSNVMSLVKPKGKLCFLETSTVKLHCKREHNFKFCFWQRATFNLSESYFWPTSLPALDPAKKRSGTKGWWEIVSCGKAASLRWKPEPFQHGVSSGELFGDAGDSGRVLHSVLKLVGINISYRPVRVKQTTFPSCSLMRPSLWLLPFPNLLMHSACVFYSCLGFFFFPLELRKDSRPNQGLWG